MDPVDMLIAGGLAGAAAVLIVWKVAARRRAPLVVVFELRLPSKWAAELTAQTLANDGVESRIVQKGAEWRCYVAKGMGRDRSQIETTCRRLNQVAEARGGGCAAHRVVQGAHNQVFEH
jgi:hypothetical protein